MVSRNFATFSGLSVTSASLGPCARVPGALVISVSKRPLTHWGRAGVTKRCCRPLASVYGAGSSDSPGPPWCGATGVTQRNHGLPVALRSAP